LTDFSDKIMRKNKKIESKIASIRSDLALGAPPHAFALKSA